MSLILCAFYTAMVYSCKSQSIVIFDNQLAQQRVRTTTVTLNYARAEMWPFQNSVPTTVTLDAPLLKNGFE